MATQRRAAAGPKCPLLFDDVPPDQRCRICPKSWPTSLTLSPSCAYLDVAYDEESFLRKGLAALDAVYTEIDMTSIALSKVAPP